MFFPIMGACCAQIKGFTLGRRELVLVSLLFKSDRICAHKRTVKKGFC